MKKNFKFKSFSYHHIILFIFFYIILCFLIYFLLPFSKYQFFYREQFKKISIHDSTVILKGKKCYEFSVLSEKQNLTSASEIKEISILSNPLFLKLDNSITSIPFKKGKKKQKTIFMEVTYPSKKVIVKGILTRLKSCPKMNFIPIKYPIYTFIYTEPSFFQKLIIFFTMPIKIYISILMFISGLLLYAIRN